MAENENPQAGGNESEGSQLRRQLEEALEENKLLKAERREQKFRDAGLDPNKGIGKAAWRLYEGDDDVEAIQQFAKDEFDWQPQPAGSNGEQQQGQQHDGQDDRWAGLAEADQQASQANTSALPSRSASLTDRIKEAEAKGHETNDWSDFDRLAVEWNRQQATS